MKLDFLPLDKLVPSKTNMRYAKRAPDVTDLLPTVRKRGVLQPVLVRPNCAPANDCEGGYEIVAGFRRFTAAQIVADERRAAGDEPDPMPCAILDDGDDAAAVEASMIENMARQDADEVTQWESFTRLVREGRSVDNIAATFGLPDLIVRRVLALGNLLPRIRAMYAKEEIDRATIRHLTLASKKQQTAWLALADDKDAYTPRGQQLKAWLFGGQSISTSHALFDVAASGLATVAFLFEDENYFADADAFWSLQNAAIEALRNEFFEAGWADAIVVPPNEHFSTWEYEKAGKRKGGRVYIDVRPSGEVAFHEGYVSRKEAARLARGESGDAAIDQKPARPEVTGTMQTYIDLHRHAAVRAAMTSQPGAALRLMVAHAIAGSVLWSVKPEPQTTRNDEVRVSVAESKAEAAFDERRRAVLALLSFGEDEPTVTGASVPGAGYEGELVAIFHRLLALPDPALFDVIAIVMGETLASGSAAVEAVGLHLGVAMADWWQADDALFGLLRDKQVLTRIVAEVAGEAVATANANEQTKTMKAIVGDHLDGGNGREAVTGWVPRWMTFPPSAYTPHGGVGTVVAHAKAEAAREVALASGDDEPDPGTPAEGAALPGDGDAHADADEAMPMAA